MQSHAALPISEHLGDDRFRVYFSSRDERNRAHIGAFDIDINEPNRILQISEQPVLAIGSLGAFDDSGVTSACLVSHEGCKYLYYSGWSLGVSVPFYFYIGLAVSRDGGRHFERVSPAPILGRSAHDPYLTASPSVLIEDQVWKMWYISGSGWVTHEDQPRHYYNIRYAESQDGIDWDVQGIVALDYADPSEYAFARPHVIKEQGIYKMWFSVRGERYRLGYAESSDGITWQRKDEHVGIGVSAAGWDSEMIEYATVIKHQDKRYMFYNGNDYGRSGIGLASQPLELGEVQ